MALARERLERYRDSQGPALGGLSLRSQARLLNRYAAVEPEEKVFL